MDTDTNTRKAPRSAYILDACKSRIVFSAHVNKGMAPFAELSFGCASIWLDDAKAIREAALEMLSVTIALEEAQARARGETVKEPWSEPAQTVSEEVRP